MPDVEIPDAYGWVFDPPTRHICTFPLDQLRHHFEGAIWRCAECKHYYQVIWDDAKQRKEFLMMSPEEAADVIYPSAKL